MCVINCLFRRWSSRSMHRSRKTDWRWTGISKSSIFFPTWEVLSFLTAFSYAQMEQMELEVRDVNPTLRSKYMHRISSYKAELSRLSQDFSRIRNKTAISCKRYLTLWLQLFLRIIQPSSFNGILYVSTPFLSLHRSKFGKLSQLYILMSV